MTVVTAKEKLGKVGKRLGFELILACVFLVLTAAGIVSFYFVGRGAVIAVQDTYYKYTGTYLSPTWPTLGFGVLVGWVPSAIIVAVRWFNRRNVPTTVQSLSVENLNTAAKKVEEATAKFQKDISENWQAMTSSMDQLYETVDKHFKTEDARWTAIQDGLAGKGTLSKAADTVKEKLGLSKSEEA